MVEWSKILIVDDEPFNVDYLAQELEDLGYQTVSATNGQEALEKVASEMGNRKTFDWLLTLKIVTCVLRVAHVVVDELIRTAWLMVLLFVAIRLVLEACRWFWLIYPGTQIGAFYLQKHSLPVFAHVVLAESLWSLTLDLITRPYLPCLVLVLLSRFLYIQGFSVSLFGQLHSIALWAGLSSLIAGRLMMQHYDLAWEMGAGLTLMPCVVYTAYAFRLGTRICPEIGPCLRWLAYITGVYDLWIYLITLFPPMKRQPALQRQTNAHPSTLTRR